MRIKSFVSLVAFAALLVIPLCRSTADEIASAVVFIVGEKDEDAFGVEWGPGMTLRQAIIRGQKVFGDKGVLLSKDGRKPFSIARLRSDDVGKTPLSPGNIIVYGPVDAEREKAVRQGFQIEAPELRDKSEEKTKP